MNRNIKPPAPSELRTQLGHLSEHIEGLSFTIEDSVQYCDEKVILEVDETNGELELLVNKDEDESSILRLQSAGDEEEISLSNLSSVELDFRPEDNQYRVITSGDRIMDFGL